MNLKADQALTVLEIAAMKWKIRKELKTNKRQ